MPKLPRIAPITDLRQDAAAVLERVKDSAEPIVITQRGRAAAVLLSPEVFERSEQERQMLRALARGERDIRKNRGVDLDRVLAEADDILEAESCRFASRSRRTPSSSRDSDTSVARTRRPPSPFAARSKLGCAGWNASRSRDDEFASCQTFPIGRSS